MSAPVFCCVCEDEPVACEFCLGKGHDLAVEREQDEDYDLEMDGNDDDYPSDGLWHWAHDTKEERWGTR